MWILSNVRDELYWLECSGLELDKYVNLEYSGVEVMRKIEKCWCMSRQRWALFSVVFKFDEMKDNKERNVWARILKWKRMEIRIWANPLTFFVVLSLGFCVVCWDASEFQYP